MPPKRKADKKQGKVPESKKAKLTAKKALEVLEKTNQTRSQCHEVDKYVPQAAYHEVEGTYSCMLNQTNIDKNNNKFYIIQLLVGPDCYYYVWTRWGRVGEKGCTNLRGPATVFDIGQKWFEEKFEAKTKNKWKNRGEFVPEKGKYTLIDMNVDDEEEIYEERSDTSGKKVLPCTIDKQTQDFIELIFDNDMFKNAMKNYDIDVKKLPLGKLDRKQIAKGFEVLESIEAVLKKGKAAAGKLTQLSSQFYTAIPHDFGRKKPPTIRDSDTLRQKLDMLMVLADIEITQSMQQGKHKATKKKDAPHPADVSYGLLKCDLTLLDPKSNEYKVIARYKTATQGNSKPRVAHIWKVNRHGEETRFRAHDKIKHRKLLWHGTDTAAVAAILKSGLRILPHSDGLLGKGIYFASEFSLSAEYLCPTFDNKAVVFLSEVALGKEHVITDADDSFTAPPRGFDSVVARGQTEPDPDVHTSLKLDGKEVVVPQGSPVEQPLYKDSFSRSEYVIYKESQARIRYVMLLGSVFFDG